MHSQWQRSSFETCKFILLGLAFLKNVKTWEVVLDFLLCIPRRSSTNFIIFNIKGMFFGIASNISLFWKGSHILPLPDSLFSWFFVFEIQDQNICAYYSRYGICKFGPACKFDHPIQPVSSPMAGVDDQHLSYGNSVTTDNAGEAGSQSGSDSNLLQTL